MVEDLPGACPEYRDKGKFLPPIPAVSTKTELLFTGIAIRQLADAYPSVLASVYRFSLPLTRCGISTGFFRQLANSFTVFLAENQPRLKYGAGFSAC
jgi:hypothetical protein